MSCLLQTRLPPRFLWAHKLGSELSSLSASPSAPGHVAGNQDGPILYELLSAYDWIPHQSLHDVEFGWGDFEDHETPGLWTRFGGHLDHNAFAIQYTIVDGQHVGYAYSIGSVSQRTCNRDLLPLGTQWLGAAAILSVEGKIGYGPASIELTEIRTNEHGHPYHTVELVAEAHDAHLQQELLGNLHQKQIELRNYLFYGLSAFGRLYGPNCDIGGWVETSDGAYWAFGGRRIKPPEE